ncbi:hypothetical protein ACQP1K_03800 [Sphaerimonospora sp. CA-214678]|uniref:hypothetical protein n=1 Tax=Sphaerimonospora sp. CA-214678 TaxID=3240029 RepID=UPI003D8A20F0
MTSPIDRVREAWHSCITTSLILPNKHSFNLVVPAKDDEGPDSPFYMTRPSGLRVQIPSDSANRLLAACETWVRSPDGPTADVYDLWQPLMIHASRVKTGEISQNQADKLLSNNMFSNSIVALPLGGIFAAEQSVTIGHNCIVGHLSTATERSIDSLARNSNPPLLGFRFNDEVAWTEDFLYAEEDEHVAEALEAELIEAEGWMPLVVAIKLSAAGSLASRWAIDIAQALAGSIWLASLPSDLNDFPYPAAPWICGADGPKNPYNWENQAPTNVEPLRVDMTNVRAERAESEYWASIHASPISLEDVIEAGWLQAITRVVEAARDHPHNSRDVIVARACQLIYTSRHATSLGVRHQLESLAAAPFSQGATRAVEDVFLTSFEQPVALASDFASLATVRDALHAMR